MKITNIKLAVVIAAMVFSGASCADDNGADMDGPFVTGAYRPIVYAPTLYSFRQGKQISYSGNKGTIEWDIMIVGNDVLTNSGTTAGSEKPGVSSNGDGGCFYVNKSFEDITAGDIPDSSEFETDKAAWFWVMFDTDIINYNSMTVLFDITVPSSGNGGPGDVEANRWDAGIINDTDTSSLNAAVGKYKDKNDDKSVYRVVSMYPVDAVAAFGSTNRAYIIRCANGSTHTKFMFVSHSFNGDEGKYYTTFKYEVL